MYNLSQKDAEQEMKNILIKPRISRYEYDICPKCGQDIPNTGKPIYYNIPLKSWRECEQFEFNFPEDLKGV